MTELPGDFAYQILDALGVHIAVIDPVGFLLYTNAVLLRPGPSNQSSVTSTGEGA